MEVLNTLHVITVCLVSLMSLGSVDSNRFLRIGILVDDNVSFLTKSLLSAYYKAAEEKVVGSLVNTIDVQELRMDSSEDPWDFAARATAFLAAETPAAMIGPPIDAIDFLFASKLPYFLVTNGSIDFIDNPGQAPPNEPKQCKRMKAHKAISVLPALDYTTYPMLYNIGNYRGLSKVNVIVITEDAESMSLFMNSDSVYMDNHPRLFPLILPETLSLEERKRRLGYTMSYSITDYIIHSYKLDYIKGVFELARSLNMMVPTYTWYLTYPDIVSISLDTEAISINNNHSRVVGVDYIGEFSAFSLTEPPAQQRVAQAVLLDSLIVLAKAVSSISGGTGPVTAAEVFKSLQTPITGPLMGLTGSLAGTNLDSVSLTTNTNMMCRKELQTDVYAFKRRTFGKVSAYKLDNSNFVKGGLKLPDFTMYPNKDVNSVLFNQLPVKVAVRLDKPLIMVNESATDADHQFYGVMIDYLKEYASAKRMNFTYRLHEVPDGNIGELSMTGWTGLVRQLLDENATLAIGSFQLSELRSKFVDATSLVQLGYLSLLMKRPVLQTSPWQFVQPFSWTLWLTVAGIYVFVSIMLYLVTFLDKQQPKFHILESFYYLAGLLLAGSTDAHPTSTPSRIIIGVFIFFSIVVFQSYTANMTAFLTMRRTGDIVNDLEALSKQSAYEYGVVNGSEAHNILVSATEEPQRRIWMYINRKPSTRVVQTYDQAIAKIGAGKFILISETVLTRYYQSQNCSLMSVDQLDTMPIRYSVGLRKGSPLIKALDSVIEQVNEEDFGEKIRKQWYPDPGCAEDFQASTSKIKTSPLSWSEMMGIFITLAIGAGVAILVGLFGWLFTRSKRQNRSVKDTDKNNQSGTF